MTKEEAIEILSRPKSMKGVPAEILTAHNMAIQALEQEPYEDAISRQTVIDAIKEYASMIWKEYREPFPESTIMEIIQALPPVKPAEKMGQWVFVKGYEGILYECTACKNKSTHTTVRWNYCPNCGAKMQEVEE